MELRSARRPLQHPELMAEDEDLEVLASAVLALLATTDEETGEGSGDEVEEGQHRPIVPGWSERESGFPIPTGPRPDAANSARFVRVSCQVSVLDRDDTDRGVSHQIRPVQRTSSNLRRSGSGSVTDSASPFVSIVFGLADTSCGG